MSTIHTPIDAVTQLPLLGKRTYLQGTTLFNHLATRLPAQTDVDFRLHTLIESDTVRIVDLDPTVPVAGSYAAILDCRVEDVPRRLGVSPEQASRSERREPFDETLITDAAITDPALGRTRLERPVDFPWLTTVVSLNKAMLLQAMECPSDGRWLFTRLEAAQVPNGYGSIELVKQSNLGFRLVRSAITVDGLALGSVYFSWLSQ